MSNLRYVLIIKKHLNKLYAKKIEPSKLISLTVITYTQSAPLLEKEHSQIIFKYIQQSNVETLQAP